MRLGLDVGGTKTDAVAVAPDGAIVARTRLATGWGPDAVVQTILAAVSGLCADPALATADIRSVGIGIPGRIEPGSGRVEHAVNLGVETLDLAAAVAPALGVPVRVENDVKAAALGAASLRGGTQSMGYLNLGTGMAAAVVTDGVLWRGARGGAGEIGHLSIDPAGPVCRCGQRGCIEALAGGGAVSARWGKPGALPIRDIFDAADALVQHLVLLGLPGEERIALPQIGEPISQLILDPRQLWLYVLNGDSNADVFDLRKRSLNGRYQLLKDASNRVTSATSLLGGISIMIGDAKGGIQQWFMVRDKDGKSTFQSIRSFQLGSSAVTQ
ncbi:MAG: ROK family protein, partial [Micrococcales bacterium]|nr:ROK family protein [Micrococcales bacterium]